MRKIYQKTTKQQKIKTVFSSLKIFNICFIITEFYNKKTI